MGLEYASEKYGVAVYSLAVSDAPLNDRLKDAFLSIMRLQNDDLPDKKMWQEHESIIKEMTSVKEGPGDGYLEKTLYGMDNKTALSLAERIFNLSSIIEDELPGIQ